MVHHPHHKVNEPMSQLTNEPTLAPHAHLPRRAMPGRAGLGQRIAARKFGLLAHWRMGSWERGSVSIEMVFFLLIFVVTFFGATEMAREVSVKHALDVGTYRAARYLSLVPSDQATAQNMIQTELDHNVLGGAGTVQMTVDMPSPAFQTIFSVTAEVSYQPVAPLMIFAPKSLRVTHSQSVEAYP